MPEESKIDLATQQEIDNNFNSDLCTAKRVSDTASFCLKLVRALKKTYEVTDTEPYDHNAYLHAELEIGRLLLQLKDLEMTELIQKVIDDSEIETRLRRGES